MGKLVAILLITQPVKCWLYRNFGYRGLEGGQEVSKRHYRP